MTKTDVGFLLFVITFFAIGWTLMWVFIFGPWQRDIDRRRRDLDKRQRELDGRVARRRGA